MLDRLAYVDCPAVLPSPLPSEVCQDAQDAMLDRIKPRAIPPPDDLATVPDCPRAPFDGTARGVPRKGPLLGLPEKGWVRGTAAASFGRVDATILRATPRRHRP